VTVVVRGLVCRDEPEDYRLIFRVYGIDGVYDWPAPPNPLPREIFILGECVAPSAERAGAVVRTTKQYLLHHGFPGRLSTAGNVAFPFTPPELSGGTAYRLNGTPPSRARSGRGVLDHRRWGRVRKSHMAGRGTALPFYGGTESSNPLSSAGESQGRSH
jgi:hypothetical protein